MRGLMRKQLFAIIPWQVRVKAKERAAMESYPVMTSSSCRGRMSDSSHHQLGDGPGTDRWGVSAGPAVRLCHWPVGDRWCSTGGTRAAASCAAQCNHHWPCSPGRPWLAKQVKTTVALWEALGMLHMQVLKLGACAEDSALGWPQPLAWSWPGKSYHHWFQQHLQLGLASFQNMHTGKCSLMRHFYKCMQTHRGTSAPCTPERGFHFSLCMDTHFSTHSTLLFMIYGWFAQQRKSLP